MHFGRDGAQLFPGLLGEQYLAELERALASVPPIGAGARLTGKTGLAGLLGPDRPAGRLAAAQLGADARPVRALVLNKTAAGNWSLGWHQDRTIAVRTRVETPGYSRWTTKNGIQHVEPPFELLETMITLRIHLDPVDAGNAPLLVAPGSHRLGRIAEADIEAVVSRCGSRACFAARGDVWLYATPILHASSVAVRPTGRRVLQVDFSGDALPPPLSWLGL